MMDWDEDRWLASKPHGDYTWKSNKCYRKTSSGSKRNYSATTKSKCENLQKCGSINCNTGGGECGFACGMTIGMIFLCVCITVTIVCICYNKRCFCFKNRGKWKPTKRLRRRRKGGRRRKKRRVKRDDGHSSEESYSASSSSDEKSKR